MPTKVLENISHSSRNIFAAVYWGLSGFALLFVFVDQNLDFTVRLVLVGILLCITYGSTRIINDWLIPQVFFKRKLLNFVYALFGLWVVSLWLILLTLVLMLLWISGIEPVTEIPSRQEILIIVFASYLIIIFASVVHFILETQQQYVEKINLKNQKKNIELHLKHAQRQLLQSQIHPHFIYNILNSIYALSRKEPKVRKIILDLSAILDYMLYECQSPQVKLIGEITFLENYINLESIRHDGNFKVEFRKELEKNDSEIAPLILFPFLENALKHGCHDGSDSSVRMDLSVVETTIYFHIRNQRRNGEMSIGRNRSSGMGLANVKERLELLYPARHDLQIEEKAEEYIVNLQIHLNEK